MDVIDTIGDRLALADEQVKVRVLTEDIDSLRSTVEHLKARKEYYKTIVERVRVIYRAATLLDVSSIGVEVLADALAERGQHTFARFGDR
jgi:hypothetical protein